MDGGTNMVPVLGKFGLLQRQVKWIFLVIIPICHQEGIDITYYIIK